MAVTLAAIESFALRDVRHASPCYDRGAFGRKGNRRVARLLFILLLLAAAPAAAQATDDAEDCVNLGKTEADAASDRRVEACTRAIESGALPQERLAATLGYVNSGPVTRASRWSRTRGRSCRRW